MNGVFLYTRGMNMGWMWARVCGGGQVEDCRVVVTFESWVRIIQIEETRIF